MVNKLEGERIVPKVLLLIHRFLQGGGTETHVRLLATKLVRDGWQVGVFTAGGPWTPYLLRQGITVHLADGDMDQRLQALRKVVARERYTLLHAHDGSSCKLAVQMKGPRTRVVMTVHGAYMVDDELRRATHKADAVIAVSEAIASHLSRIGIRRDRIHVIQNGISTHTFHPGRSGRLRVQQGVPADAFVIGYAGRFTYAKGELGKRVMRALHPYVLRNPDVYVLVAGRNSQEELSTRHPRIKICGHVDDMGSFYRSCDLVIGTGRVALEAAATATPTIAVGEMGFVGRLSCAQIDEAIKTNFGDHGRHRKAWGRAQLLQAVRESKANQAQAQADARELAKQIARRFSASKMSRAVVRVYRHTGNADQRAAAKRVPPA